jgi:PAS domain S-box-containing protein
MSTTSRKRPALQADAVTFADMFRVDPDSGRITLGEDRYVMFDAEAIGKMRRELIDSLGWDVARGILERVGYQSGRNDARQLGERYPWPSDEEWLRAGPRLHFLEGMVKVQVGKLDVSRSGHRFHMEGDWIGSYEAEQHLKQYGVGTRPVCWSLEGYATGYASEFFGEDVVCFEVRCRGKGDPVCSFELRLARDWGHAALPIQEMLAAVRFTERFDRCLRSISEMGCELEQSSLDAIFTTDARGTITSCSQGGSELLGFLPGEAIGKPVSSIYAGGRAEAGHVMSRLRSDGRIRYYLTDIVAANGRKIPIALAASAIKNAMGAVVGTIGVAHNLTEIRRLEDELATKNRFMANILQDSADAIVTMDPDGVITSWNRGAESIFGYASEEVRGKSIKIIIPPDLQAANELEVIAQRVRTQGAVRSYQTERVTKDGRRLQVIFTRTAIKDDTGRVIGSSAVLKDVTTFRNLERQLADAEHLATLGELSAGLAHEIKNPLAGIKGAIDVIRDSLPATDVHREVLGDVLHEVNRIDKIVRDLLNYAKPKPSSLSAIALPEVAQRLVAMARKSPKTEQVSIQMEQSGEIPGFTGDETQLEQVLLNLLLNAQSAVPPGGHITVRLSFEPEDMVVRMEVEDDGPGIPEEIRKRIFQPFFTTRTEGTGLGLATCLKNVQYHGGTIIVSSEPGRGTKFLVNLPLLCRF